MKTKALLLVSAALTQAAFGNIVFQANFNGPDSGTGGANDIVQYGGTGTLTTTGTGTSVSVTNNQLVINDTGSGGTGYALFSPTSAANALDSWYTEDGIAPGLDKLEGALDFFFTTNSNTGITGSSYRFVDQTFGPSNDLRIVITNNVSTNNDSSTFALQILDYTTGSGILVTTPSTTVDFTPGTLYHVGVSVTTDASTGIVTGNVFAAEGNTTISTSSPSNSSTRDRTFNINTDPNTDYTFRLGLLQDKPDAKIIDINTFRLYDSVPTEFGAIPESSTIGLLLGGFSLLAALGFKRFRH